MANGKLKGNSYEILVSRSLSNFLTENTRDDLFWRSSNSGGRQTVRARKGIDTHNQAGDICNTHPDGENFMEAFVLECKHYKDANLWSIFTHAQGNTIMGWWDVHLEKASQVKKYPILIVRQNYKPDLFITTRLVSDYLLSYCKIESQVVVKHEMHDLYVYQFDNILKLNPKQFNKMIKELSK